MMGTWIEIHLHLYRYMRVLFAAVGVVVVLLSCRCGGRPVVVINGNRSHQWQQHVIVRTLAKDRRPTKPTILSSSVFSTPFAITFDFHGEVSQGLATSRRSTERGRALAVVMVAIVNPIKNPQIDNQQKEDAIGRHGRAA